jgi:hypothetical protein
MVKADSKRWNNNSPAGKLLDSLFKNNELAPGAAASRVRQAHHDIFGEFSVAVFRNAFNRARNRHGTVVRNAQAKQKPKGKVDCCCFVSVVDVVTFFPRNVQKHSLLHYCRSS